MDKEILILVYSCSEIKHCSYDNCKCHDKSAFSSAVRPEHPQYEAMHIDTVSVFFYFSLTRRVAFLGQSSFTFVVFIGSTLLVSIAVLASP